MNPKVMSQVVISKQELLSEQVVLSKEEVLSKKVLSQEESSFCQCHPSLTLLH